MSMWIDPKGVKALLVTLLAEQRRLAELAASSDRLHPHGRRAARYHGRHDQVARMIALVREVARPAIELQPHKSLIAAAADDRRAKLDALILDASAAA